MSDRELLQIPRIRIRHAARYLQDGTTEQELRIKAQNGQCPFCVAEKRSPDSQRFVYRINPGLLIAYKHGKLGNGMQQGCQKGGSTDNDTDWP